MRSDSRLNCKKFFFNIQVPLCAPEKLKCIRNVTVDNSNCLQTCSGMLITSYTVEEIEKQLPKLVSMLTNYFGKKNPSFDDIENTFKGSPILYLNKLLSRIKF